MNASYVLPLGNKWLFHDASHQVTALLNRTALDIVKGNRRGDNYPMLLELGNLLQDTGPHLPGPAGRELQPAFLGLVTTRACNLSCVYCNFGAAHFEAGHSMDAKLAVAAVDWMANYAVRHRIPSFEVHFFGGEPLCALQTVEAAVHRGRLLAARLDLDVKYEVSTNGMFNDATAAFVGDYFDSVVLSMDGPASIHDRYRPLPGGAGSHAAVVRNARELSRRGTELCIRTCISADSVESMEEIAFWMGDEIVPASVSFESLQTNAAGRDSGLRPPDPWAFAAGYWKAHKALRAMGIKSVYGAVEEPQPRRGFCPLARDALIVAPDGRVHGCYLLEEEWLLRDLELTYGCINKQGDMQLNPQAIQEIRDLSANHPDRCQHCFAFWYCAGGCKVNQSFPGCADTYNDFCIQTRLILACRLLEQIECHQEIDNLLFAEPAARALALQENDCFMDWKGGNV